MTKEQMEGYYKTGNSLYSQKVYGEALIYWEMAAKGGHAPSMYNLGVLYCNGQGVEQDVETALDWFLKAAEQDFPDALFQLGRFNEYGIVVEQNLPDAYLFYERAASLGYEQANERMKALEHYKPKDTSNDNSNDSPFMSDDILQDMYESWEKGEKPIVDWSWEKAEELNKRLSSGPLFSSNNNRSQLSYDYLAEGNKYYEAGNYSEAIRCWKNAENYGNDKAAYNLFLVFSDQLHNNAEAMRWLRKAAESGYVDAQYQLGLQYYIGDMINKDNKEAAKWLLKASEQGCVECHSLLGTMYENGWGVPQDGQKAYRYLKSASDHGDFNAMTKLGVMYLEGKCVKRDFHHAFRLANHAAIGGDSYGYSVMGFIYEFGYGVRRDKQKAAQLYRIAAMMGFEPAKSKSAELAHYIRNPWVVFATDLAKDYVKEQIKDLMSDIISDAVDKMLDESGSVIADIVGDAVADSAVDYLFSAFDS